MKRKKEEKRRGGEEEEEEEEKQTTFSQYFYSVLIYRIANVNWKCTLKWFGGDRGNF